MLRKRPIWRGARAFTLIEILVVVGILALLVAILLPSLRNARAQGKAVVCGTHLNELFKATLLYTLKNDDRLPYYGWPEGRSDKDANPQWWPTQLAKLIGNQYEIYTCPSDPKPYQIDVIREQAGIRMVRPLTEEAKQTVKLDLTYRSSCDTMEPIAKSVYRARKISSWKRPGQALLMVEGSAQIGNPLRECFRFLDHLKEIDNRKAWSVATRISPDAALAWESWRRHLGNSSFLFMDGHVIRLTPEQAARMTDTYEHNLAADEAALP